MKKKKLSHVDEKGKANMVDISDKKDVIRIAIAEGFISLSETTVSLIKNNELKKGDIMSVVTIAGIQAAKKTSELIPLCHPILIQKIDVKPQILDNGVKVTAIVKSTGKTGVEMEALTAVSVALLTIYDMCKAVDKNMVISNIHLIEKSKLEISQK